MEGTSTVEDSPTISQSVEVEFSYDIDVCLTDDPIYMKRPEQASLQRYEVEQCLPGDGGREEWTMTINKYRISVQNDKNIFKLMVKGVQPCKYTKTH